MKVPGTSVAPDVVIRPAVEPDAPGIVAVLVALRDEPSLFQRSESDVRQTIGDFTVAEAERRRVLACAALHRHSAIAGEILSVAVLPEVQGLGIGGRLIDECVRRARESGLRQVWLGTIKPAYFARFDFTPRPLWEFVATPAVLATKMRAVYAQPLDRWLPALLGRYTFMVRSI
jgi:amino-acid N-acetyltransferase